MQQRKHSNSVKQDGVKVQNVDFDSANNAEYSFLGKIIRVINCVRIVTIP